MHDIRAVILSARLEHDLCNLHLSKNECVFSEPGRASTVGVRNRRGARMGPWATLSCIRVCSAQND